VQAKYRTELRHLEHNQSPALFLLFSFRIFGQKSGILENSSGFLGKKSGDFAQKPGIACKKSGFLQEKTGISKRNPGAFLRKS
jgi:hypothetical protein